MLKFYDLLPPPEDLSDKEVSRIADFLMELACAFESEYSEHIKRHYKNEINDEQALYNYMASTTKRDDPENTF